MYEDSSGTTGSFNSSSESNMFSSPFNPPRNKRHSYSSMVCLYKIFKKIPTFLQAICSFHVCIVIILSVVYMSFVCRLLLNMQEVLHTTQHLLIIIIHRYLTTTIITIKVKLFHVRTQHVYLQTLPYSKTEQQEIESRKLIKYNIIN